MPFGARFVLFVFVFCVFFWFFSFLFWGGGGGKGVGGPFRHPFFFGGGEGRVLGVHLDTKNRGKSGIGGVLNLHFDKSVTRNEELFAQLQHQGEALCACPIVSLGARKNHPAHLKLKMMAPFPWSSGLTKRWDLSSFAGGCIVRKRLGKASARLDDS